MFFKLRGFVIQSSATSSLERGNWSIEDSISERNNDIIQNN